MRHISRRCLGALAFAAASVALTSRPALAQDVIATGRIVGRVIDATNGQGIAEVDIKISGTTIGARSGVEGRYTITAAPTGPVSLDIRRIGYQAKTVTGLLVKAGAATEQDISISTAIMTLAAVVSVEAERGSVAAAVDQQRSAIGVVSSVTADQIAKSPDGDAAQAVRRSSGVTVENGTPSVRGTPPRYTTVSLNNVRVPSPEPEQRTVPMDIFPAGLVQTITTTKTFTPDIQGDFAGAVVNIETKEFPAHHTASLQLGSGYAPGATGASVPFATSVGGEGFALVNHGRDLPATIRGFGDLSRASLTQTDVNHIVGSFRDAWTPRVATGAPHANGSASFGGNDVFLGHRIGYLVSGTMSTGADVKDHQLRARADRGGVKGSTVEIDRFEGRTVSQSVLWGGLTNLSTMFGDRSRVSFNGLLNRSADNDARVERGLLTGDGIPAVITRMQYVERGIYSAQFAGDHQLSDSRQLTWTATASGVRRLEPDHSEFVQVIEHDTPTGPEVLRWLSGGNGGAVRTFGDLHEHSYEFGAKYKMQIGPADSRTTVTVGALDRTTSRDATTLSYSISANGASNAIRELPAEEIFDGRFSTPTSNVFTFGPLAQGGSYTARDHLDAAFGMAEVPVGDNVRVVGGLRFEADRLEVDATSTLGSPVETKKNWNDPLPSLAVNIQLSPSQQLRVSGSRTLARPEYREISPITSRDVIGGENVAGDQNLNRTNVTNVDVRWEHYPEPGELLSVALFAKQFVNPIERVYGSGSGGTSTVFFTNAKGADDYGVELELRRSLGRFATALSQFTVFGNTTLMHSQIRLDKNTTAAATNLNRRMVGQAPYVINGGLTYASTQGRSSATVLFNRVGERITAAGSSPLPDAVALPRNVVDLSLRLDVRSGVTARIDMKNLLDAPYEVHQGTVTREFYRMGSTIQAGLQWRP